MNLITQNVVIAAHQFNPSIFSQLWLVKHKIIQEDEFESGAMFSDAAVQIPSKRFHLLVVPEMLQFTIKAEREDDAELVAEKIMAIANLLPQTPYTAIGLNFIWHHVAEEAEIAATTRRIFFRQNLEPFKSFGTEDALFGGYLSKDFGGARLKLDIKPAHAKVANDPVVNVIHLQFNFHRDLTADDAMAGIKESIESWQAAKAESADISGRLLKDH